MKILTAVSFFSIQAAIQPVSRFSNTSSREASNDKLSQLTLSNKSAMQNSCTYLITIVCILLHVFHSLKSLKNYQLNRNEAELVSTILKLFGQTD